MKKLSIIVLFIALFAVGCEKWDHKIAAVEDRLELLEGTTIPNIEQQIVNINASIEDLKAVDEALQGLIDNLEAKAEELQAQLDANAAADAATKAALESEIANLKALIAALQAKDVELDQKIADLQKYVDDEISATEDWANQTFSTLEQYADMQQEISALKALLEQYKSEITDAYTDAIKTAINASEASMKDWVNKTLAEGYYTKAEIDGKVSALETKIEEGDDALQKEIDALKAALEKAEGDLTVAYVEAIEKAINDNNGKISAEIAAAVKTAQDNLQAQIDAINNEIEKINTRLDIIEADINSIKQQIDDLKGVDAELKGYIESLQNTANDLQSKIDATNDALAVLESDLEGQITASEQKVLDELKTVKTALEGQLATIKETTTTLTSRLTIIEGTIVQLFKAIDECATQEDVNEVKQNLATVLSDIAAMKVDIKDLQDRMDTVEGEVDSLQTAVANLESRIEALEKNFASRIQSLKYLPEYNDGKAAMDYATLTMNLDFIVSPAEVATLLKQQFDADNSVIKAYVRYTKTRAAGDIVEQKVSAMSVGENGIFTLTIEGQNLSDEFRTGALDAVIYIQIIDQNGNNVVSDMIPIVAKGVKQLAMPTNVRTEQISRGVMRISWDPVPNADFYEFCQGNPTVGRYLPIDNCYYDLEYTEGDVGITQQYGIKAASNSLLYTTSEAYMSMSGVVFPELLSEVSIEYEATEQLTLTEGTFGDATYTHTFADGKGTITFDSSVTEYSIANNAFRETPALTSITFSEGLTTIGSNAFYSCAALEKVVIKGDVTAIGQNAFASCSSLSTVEYYGTTELTTSNAFFDTTLLFVSVTDAYPSAVFCGKMARKEL
ncbi:MAG: leucine-rich repeat protein [Alistipes sp.]|nr:leucine-rich repeat protein [Alistipes sp.]